MLAQQLFLSLAEQDTVPQSQAADTWDYVGQPLPFSLPVFLLAGPRPVALGAGDKVPLFPCEDLNSAP